jgi:hypothetical protein
LLFSYGINASVNALGPKPDGTLMYSISCSSHLSKKAIELIYFSNGFLNELDFQTAFKLKVIRNERSINVASFLTSKKMVIVSILALITLIIGLLVETYA